MSALTAQIKNDKRYKSMRLRVLDRDGHTCQWCRSIEDLTIDHIVALANGGDPFDDDNAMVLCRSCNSSKGDRALVRVDWLDPVWFGAA